MKNDIKNMDNAENIWATSWTYIRTVIDTAREPFLILDRDLRIIAVNSCFLRTFEVSDKNTEGRLVYDLGNGQWNIPKLKNLLEDILPRDTFFKDFEVDHEFPGLGRRIMMLNARKIFSTAEPHTTPPMPPLILLAMEDVTDRRLVSEKLAEYAQKIENNIGSKMEHLSTRVDELAVLHKIIADRDSLLEELRNEIRELKKKIAAK
jgi:nitrogen-specific signal transduction histidine kinase